MRLLRVNDLLKAPTESTFAVEEFERVRSVYTRRTLNQAATVLHSLHK